MNSGHRVLSPILERAELAESQNKPIEHPTGEKAEAKGVTMTTAPTSPSARREFERLYQRSHRRAYNLAYRLTGNSADAEDVTQDAYVRAWNNFDNYDSSRSFESWLFRIITNRAIDLRRRQKRVPIYSLDAPVTSDEDGQTMVHEFPAPNSNPEELVVGPIMEERLQQALAALPEDYRTAILLCDVEEKSYQEIAEIMGCAIGTVRSRIHRARVMMRRFLEEGSVPRTRRSRLSRAQASRPTPSPAAK
ncbi:MAG TPA: sigma-70 family RNA polymerase sigma factor [Chthonomonas sp.]|uniref:sigma-70 family RNA polymerase sigma factor n=1 Tax=Chthonomonas sp. TaxID=2282153 RepID=UPI002B4B599C|nr:sigma-70 family RNA polymerase sigma factor [Chthonomonas sp.]HLI49455.1 sigma-70 family RNA polymerase sigma factor [Chthonomonas sp.]